MPIRIDRERDVLGVIDLQPTFMPGGELPVPDGHAVVEPIGRLLAGIFAHAFATQDWHPPGHVSFASTHGAALFSLVTLPYGEQTLWPDHAVIGSPGAVLHPGLDLARVEAVFRKGFRPAVDSYSAFRDNDRVSPTGLAGWMRERGFRRVVLCGLALDFCVAWSALDAREMGFEVVVVEDACRAIAAPLPPGGTTWDAARTSMRDAGVQFAAMSDFAVG